MMPNPWIWADIGGATIIFGLCALGAFIAGIGLWLEFRRLAFAQAMISGQQLVGTYTTIPLAVALAWVAYAEANEHRLLRGECRYTVAWVYENHHHKGDQESRFEFWVHGERYRFDERMEWRGGWRPLHSRWYVRYAVPDPDVYTYPDIPVPDSVRVVPNDGWVSLPASPITVPAPVAAPASEPLTGPAASPVFQAAPTDSTRPPSVEASKNPILVVPRQ